MHIRTKAYLYMASAAIVTATLSGCGDKTDDAAQHTPPPKVGYIEIKPDDKPVELVSELPGRLEASRVAEIRARVPGILLKRMFEEGSYVQENQQLFQIDDAPYVAALQSAEASVAEAEANVMQTRAQAQRFKPLVGVNAVSKQDYDNAVAAQKTAEASLSAGKAAVTTAKINLDYAAVTSPISGKIGRALVTEGALVGQGTATELAVVQQIDPLYVNFTQSAIDALKLREAISRNLYKEGERKITITLEDGNVYSRMQPTVQEDGTTKEELQPVKGELLFEDLTVDATSGQVTLRATFPNPDHFLLPGLYVRVRVPQAIVENRILVPQQAVTQNEQGATVMVIKRPGNEIEVRQIKLGPPQQEMVYTDRKNTSAQAKNKWLVLEGLKKDDWVVVDGFQSLPQAEPGKSIVVDPVLWQEGGQKLDAGSPTDAGTKKDQPAAAPTARQ